MSLLNREIVLAGGSGGLGQPTARLLASEGAKLTVSYHRDTGRAATLKDLATLMEADITKQADREALLDAAPSLYLISFAELTAPGDRAGSPAAEQRA